MSNSTIYTNIRRMTMIVAIFLLIAVELCHCVFFLFLKDMSLFQFLLIARRSLWIIIFSILAISSIDKISKIIFVGLVCCFLVDLALKFISGYYMYAFVWYDGKVMKLIAEISTLLKYSLMLAVGIRERWLSPNKVIKHVGTGFIITAIVSFLVYLIITISAGYVFENRYRLLVI